uniref:protein CBFA2T3 isoform X7 n=1 Tax=Agelaius phoeniceus TaxID=39638 RepID=UPI0023ECABE6|nr:protein CBFA2T3 isoform X7 [Agelaius phoeniceus]
MEDVTHEHRWWVTVTASRGAGTPVGLGHPCMGTGQDARHWEGDATSPQHREQGSPHRVWLIPAPGSPRHQSHTETHSESGREFPPSPTGGNALGPRPAPVPDLPDNAETAAMPDSPADVKTQARSSPPSMPPPAAQGASRHPSFAPSTSEYPGHGLPARGCPQLLLTRAPAARSAALAVTRVTAPGLSDEREQPLANRHQWGSVHPQRVQQRASHLLQRLPVHPPAPSSLWCPPALQAEALPHHPAAVWERHLPRDRGAGAHPRPGARELHPHHRGVSRQAPRGHQLPTATLRHPLPQGQPASAAAGAAALRPHGQADPGPVPGPARAAAAGRQRLLSHRLLRAAPGGGRERQEEDARQDQRERFGPRPPAPRAPQQAAVHHEPSAALQPQQRAEPPPKRAGAPPRRPPPAPALPPGGHGHGTPLPGHLPAPRPPGAPAARRRARDAAGGGDRPPAHGPGVGGGVEAPQQPAELHHGHGGEDAAVADGAAAVPGGRSRGAQPLDPALQRRRGHEERQPPLGTPPQLLLCRRRGSPVRRSPGLRAAAALRVHARGDLEEGRRSRE